MTGNVPPGVPENLITPQGNVPAVGIGTSQDYPRLVFSAPRFETVAIAEIIQPSVTEAVENVLPSLVPPYVDNAVLAGIQQYAVLLTGSTMSGPLFLNPLMPTADSQAATKAYVDTMLATAGIPEVPPVPVGQIWGRETGQWTPISQAEGTFLPITGGSMQGNINMSGNTITNLASVPAMPNGAAPAQWVLNNIAAVSLYQGTWDADTNTPDLTQLSTHVNAWTWIAITTSVSGVVIGAAIPGLQGQTVFNGDTIIYSTAQGAFSSIHAGGISLPEADGRYVQLAGSQMSGALLLNANATQPLQAATFGQLEAAVANTVTPDAPADGQAYLRVGVGTNRWVPGLPLAGGILTGALTLSGPGASGNNAVTVAQMNSAISGAGAGFLPIAGGTMTGALVLNGNAAANLNAVPLQQLNATLNTYAPLQNPAFSGVPTVPLAAPGTSTAQIASTQFVTTALGAYVPIAGGTVTGNLTVNGALSGGTGSIGGVSLPGSGNISGVGTLTAGTVSAATLTASGGTNTPTINLAGNTIAGGTNVINFTTGTADFGNNLTVTGTLAVNSGSLNLNGNTVVGGSNAITITTGNVSCTNNISAAGTISCSNDVWGHGGNCRVGNNGVSYNALGFANYNGLVWNGSNAFVFVDGTNEGSIQGPSDENLKENFGAVEADCLAAVCAIELRSYDWKEPKNPPRDTEGNVIEQPRRLRWQAGYIAQDIAGVIPEAVIEMDDAPLCVDTRALLAYLIGAVQQLNTALNARA